MKNIILILSLLSLSITTPARAQTKGYIVLFDRLSPCTVTLTAPGPLPAFVQPGSIVCLHAGVYPHGQLRITSNSATYQGAPGEHATLLGSGSLEVYGHDVTLAGFDIDNGNLGAPAIVLRGDHARLIGNEIHNGAYNGVEVRGVGAEIAGNRIHNFDSGVLGLDAHCIDVLPTGGAVVVNLNDIHDCSGDGIQAFYPNSVPGPGADLAGGTITGNIFTRGSIQYSENAIDLKRGRGWAVAGNLLDGYGHEPAQLIAGGNPALFIHKWSQDVWVTGNVISGSTKGVQVFGNSGLDIGANPISVTVSGNTFLRIGPGYTLNVVGGISVTVAPNTNLPSGYPTVTAAPRSTPTATSTTTQTATSVPTPTNTAVPSATPVSGCWDLRHSQPVAILCP